LRGAAAGTIPAVALVAVISDDEIKDRFTEGHRDGDRRDVGRIDAAEVMVTVGLVESIVTISVNDVLALPAASVCLALYE
jgi:hypothetical protein